MNKDPNTERIAENAVKPLRKEIDALKQQIQDLWKAIQNNQLPIE